MLPTQVQVEEAEFRANSSEWSSRLSSGHIQGVWEERLPLRLHATFALGCVAELEATAKGRALGDTFALSDLKACTNP